MRVFCDLDGVLADLEGHYKRSFGIETSRDLDNIDWALVNTVPNFFESIPLMDDALMLWSYVVHHNPVILTGVPKEVTVATLNKVAWVRTHLGEGIPVICCRSHAKWECCKPGDVLIDDWEKYQDRWLKAGGVWITHTSARDTIAKLKEIGL